MRRDYRTAIAAMMAVVPGPAVASGFCDQARMIASHSANDFQALRGPPQIYGTTLLGYQAPSLPGATSCEITVITKEFQCNFEGSRAEVKARTAQLISETRQCFPNAYMAERDKGNVAFWVGDRGGPGAFMVNILPLKTKYGHLVVYQIDRY